MNDGYRDTSILLRDLELRIERFKRSIVRKIEKLMLELAKKW